MALKLSVKINHINNLSDARYCAGMGVDYLGFSVETESEYFSDPQSFAEITGWISGPEYIAEFDNYAPERILKTLEKYPVDKIEIRNPDFLKEVNQFEKPVILNLDIDVYDSINHLEEDLARFTDLTDFIIITSRQKGLLNIKNLDKLSSRFRIFAGYGVSEKNIDQLADQSTVSGIALDSEKESVTGFKDYDRLGKILEKIEVEDFT